MSRCDERLKARVEETCLTYTGLFEELEYLKNMYTHRESNPGRQLGKL